MDTQWLDVVGVIGSMLSLVGVMIAIWQIVKTRRAAEAATAAASRTHRRLTRNLLLSDLTSSTSSMEGVKALIRGGRYEAALLRISDLMNRLNQLKALPSPGKHEMSFPEVLTQLHVIRDLLERRLASDAVKFDSLRVLDVLSTIADELNGWIGYAKYTMPEVSDNDS